MSKKNFGQFYTVNYSYILNGFEKPSGKVLEPFAGKGDLIDWLDHDNYEAYDIDPKRGDIIMRDTLLNPPCYKDTYIITNPPYLARNKSTTKDVYDRYQTNDLYKCFITSLIEQKDGCLGGIFILPVGFFISPRETDVKCRDAFMSKYKITKVTFFEETVFPDTPTTVVAFSFVKSPDVAPLEMQLVEWEQRPSGNIKVFNMEKKYKWIVGGDIYNLRTDPNIKISRFVENKENENVTSLTLRALDSGMNDGRICLEYKKDYVYHGLDTSRTFATLCIRGVKLTDEDQMRIAREFNELLETKRKEYWSLFLPQYRESKEYARKRIPFDLSYKIVSNLIFNQSK